MVSFPSFHDSAAVSLSDGNKYDPVKNKRTILINRGSMMMGVAIAPYTVHLFP
jgi:hypothetical protein